METVKTTCCKTRFGGPKKFEAANGSMSFFSTVLLILIPKCPLCLTAYMSAMVLFFDIEYETLVPILLHTKPFMGILIITMILLNRKDKRTLVSLAFAALAFIMLILKTYFATALFMPDWIIYITFIFAIWYNGNFQYFYRFIKSKKSKTVSLE
ncbi:hypothetical protein [Maribacter aestuarii]|uniref:hypothetical protein n=1 Tax=Maribacter aestuarii TaxID=1130723 RepID=UPI0025A62CCA|nr:hypothetical protein [Maribacter aestuarii]